MTQNPTTNDTDARIPGHKLITHGGMDALVYGELVSDPECHTDRLGKAFTTARLRVAAEGTDADSVVVHLITRVPTVGMTLQQMRIGDRIAVNGPVSFKYADDGHVSVGITARRMVSNYRTIDFTQRKSR